jgi:large subunit ribosomal protein L21
MYAVIATGGKQERVEQGQRVQVERLGPVDSTVEFSPILLVDGDTVLATPDQLAGAKVTARIVGEERGPKITGFVYQAKARRRRRWGHRQTRATIEITGITKG